MGEKGEGQERKAGMEEECSIKEMESIRLWMQMKKNVFTDLRVKFSFCICDVCF